MTNGGSGGCRTRPTAYRLLNGTTDCRERGIPASQSVLLQYAAEPAPPERQVLQQRAHKGDDGVGGFLRFVAVRRMTAIIDHI